MFDPPYNDDRVLGICSLPQLHTPISHFKGNFSCQFVDNNI